MSIRNAELEDVQAITDLANNCAPDLSHTRRLAWVLKQRNKVKAIALWPEVGDSLVKQQREHILAFCMGMNDG